MGGMESKPVWETALRGADMNTDQKRLWGGISKWLRGCFTAASVRWADADQKQAEHSLRCRQSTPCAAAKGAAVERTDGSAGGTRCEDDFASQQSLKTLTAAQASKGCFVKGQGSVTPGC